MAGDRCTVSQMADVIMEGLEEYAQLAADDMKKGSEEGWVTGKGKDIQGECPCENRCLCKELGGEDLEGNCQCNGDRGVFQKQVPAGTSAGVRSCAEKRRQDKGLFPILRLPRKGLHRLWNGKWRRH